MFIISDHRYCVVSAAYIPVQAAYIPQRSIYTSLTPAHAQNGQRRQSSGRYCRPAYCTAALRSTALSRGVRRAAAQLRKYKHPQCLHSFLPAAACNCQLTSHGHTRPSAMRLNDTHAACALTPAIGLEKRAVSACTHVHTDMANGADPGVVARPLTVFLLPQTAN